MVESDRDYRIETTFREVANRLFALSVVANFIIPIVDSAFFLKIFRTFVGGLVEGFIEFSTRRINDSRLNGFRPDFRHLERKNQKDENKFCHGERNMMRTSTRNENCQFVLCFSKFTNGEHGRNLSPERVTI